VRGKRGLLVGTAFAATIGAGCGGTRQDAGEPSGRFALRVDHASFPSAQSVSRDVTLSLVVRNAGSRTAPDVAVTLLGRDGSTASAAFAETSDQSGLASRSKPIWIVDHGPGGGDTAYSNSWSLGPLAPGRSRRFSWTVTPARPGHFDVVYRVAAGLTGKARAVGPGGRAVTGHFRASISDKPAQATVDAAGNVVTGGG
jgi:hypothetical protein